MRRARRADANRLRLLLTELEVRRQNLKRLWETHPLLREYVSETAVIVLQGRETPLATLVFSDALNALGFRTRTYEALSSRAGLEVLAELPRSVTRLVLVLGHGVDEAAVYDQSSELFARLRVKVGMTNLFLLSQSGSGIFPEEFENAYLTDYLQEAASLAKIPPDEQFEDRAKDASENYR